MPRKPRELMDLGIYHIVGRGNNRQKVYRDEADYEQKLALLLQAKQKWNFELFHYCLMPNHFHFLVRGTFGTGTYSEATSNQNISKSAKNFM